jgi:SH3 domain-containing protein
MRMALTVAVALLAWTPAGAGELIFANGSKLQGDLSNESLMVSTGSGLVEIVPDEVVLLTREEIRLRDGRVIRGTLVGGQIKARTSLGEIAVKVDELQTYRASAPSAEPGTGTAPAAAPAAPASASAPAGSSPASATPAVAKTDTGIVSGLPTVAAYQNGMNGRAAASGTPPVTVQTAVLTRESPTTAASRTYEVVGESALYRDALFSSSRVGRVAAGTQVTYVDSIDRRLRILNLLVFDGGHWVKIRLSDGTEGWVPADTVREVQ